MTMCAGGPSQPAARAVGSPGLQPAGAGRASPRQGCARSHGYVILVANALSNRISGIAGRRAPVAAGPALDLQRTEGAQTLRHHHLRLAVYASTELQSPPARGSART